MLSLMPNLREEDLRKIWQRVDTGRIRIGSDGEHRITKPRNPRSFGIAEGGRKRALDTFMDFY